jgi:DNA-binding response OmpR family regulator
LAAFAHSPVVACFDSSAAFVELLTLWLAKDGVRVVAGGGSPPTDPTAGAAFIGAVQPDACICEVRNAEARRGFETLRRALPDRPFILITSDCLVLDDRAGSQNPGGVPVLVKPFDLERLSDTLRSMLARSAAAASAGVA